MCDIYHLQNVLKQKRKKVLTTLKQFLSNHYLCINCDVLHFVNFKNLLIVSHLKQCLLKISKYITLFMNFYYEICFQHVQLAIKYMI